MIAGQLERDEHPTRGQARMALTAIATVATLCCGPCTLPRTGANARNVFVLVTMDKTKWVPYEYGSALHSPLSDAERSSDLFVQHPLGDEAQHCLLSVAEKPPGPGPTARSGVVRTCPRGRLKSGPRKRLHAGGCQFDRQRDAV
jgi:hypothetical protein